MKPRKRGRVRVRNVVIVVPSLFTLANLFFGFWSMVLAARGEFYLASWWIVIAGILDLLDGVSARVGNSGTAFGAELDSLVDLVSFGIAPGILLYFMLFSQQDSFAWVFSYAFAVCVALRLAKFNSQEEGGSKRHFTGIPSTAAGMTLAAYYPFTQTAFYQAQLQTWPWSKLMIFLVIALSLAMVSNVQYAKMPRIGVRSLHGLAGLGVHVILLWFGIFNRDIFFFPLGIAYLTYGFVRWAIVASQERGEEDPEDDFDQPDLLLHEVEHPQQSTHNS